MRIAIIPARGGSKRIPRKNVRPFLGKPMIAWSIEAARNSGLFEHVLVSTDDPEIAAIARQFGAEVPFERPAELSGDEVGITDVVAHAVQWAISARWPLTQVCCVMATCPFLRPSDLGKGLELLEDGDWMYAFSAAAFGAPVFRSFTRDDEGGIAMQYPEHFATRSQDLPTVLHDAAQFYWGRPDAWLGRKRLFDRHSTVVVLPGWRVQDIDTEEDWKRAEIIAPAVLREAGCGASSTRKTGCATNQELFWATTHAQDYIERNSRFDHELGAQAWAHMLGAARGVIRSFLELGCNIGRNIEQLRRVIPDATPSIVEISKPAFDFVTSKYRIARAFNGAILDSDFERDSFDLVFTMGVLIHVRPDQVLQTMSRMLSYSSRYVLIGEYFNRTPTAIEYQGRTDLLFKRDFGKLFIENFSVRLVDYGFLWGHIYDPAGFDDITWWLFEKPRT